MIDYTGTGSENNPWDLKELKYNGELFHYTYASACKGIFCHEDCPDFPHNSISLRFTRIDQMAKKNDPNERMHIDKAVKKIAQKLSKQRKIDSDFLKLICDYESTCRGFYSLALDEMDAQFHRPQRRLLMDFGPLDYYVACFSTNPNNEHITKEFKTSIRITFNADFSRRCNDPHSFELRQEYPGMYICNFGNGLYPLQSIRECFVNTYLRRIEYIDTSANIDNIKSSFVEEKIMNIYKEYLECSKSEVDKILWSIEDMCSLCDAFIKDVLYTPEEEVRFVIRLPQRDHFVKEHGQFPKWLAENHFVFGENGTYLQLPISEEFITL